jgi:DNA modification methylase
LQIDSQWFDQHSQLGKMTDLTLHQGDNFNFVEASSVDFVLTDPPFNISKKTNFASYEKNTIHSYQFDSESGEDWDSYSHEEFLERLDEWSKEWSRVLRKGGSFAIFCADSYTSHLMEALKRNGLSPRRLITWRKNNAVPVNRQYMPMSANEYIVVGVKEGKNVTFNADVPIVEQSLDDKIIESTIVADKVSTIVYSKVKEAILNLPGSDLFGTDHIELISQIVENTLEASKKEAVKKTQAIYKVNEDGSKYLQACVPNYIQNPLKVGNRLHPTEKPVPLLQFLVALYSKPGDTILDGFGGSGSSGEAALSLGRNAVIVEREANFFNKLQARLAKQADKVLTI